MPEQGSPPPFSSPAAGILAELQAQPIWLLWKFEPNDSQGGKPEEIKICDPACGSGHMLTFAFDLLYAIYEEEGYPYGSGQRLGCIRHIRIFLSH